MGRGGSVEVLPVERLLAGLLYVVGPAAFTWVLANFVLGMLASALSAVKKRCRQVPGFGGRAGAWGDRVLWGGSGQQGCRPASCRGCVRLHRACRLQTAPKARSS